MLKTRLLFGAALLLGLIVLFLPRSETRVIAISHTALQMAIDDALAVSSEVGFIPRVRFGSITVIAGDILQIKGTGRWFSVGSGAFGPPDVTFTAVFPTDVAAWTVTDGRLVPNALRILDAYRQPFTTIAGREEGRANRDGWSLYLARFVGRLDVLRDDHLAQGDWVLIAVENGPDGLVFTLED